MDNFDYKKYLKENKLDENLEEAVNPKAMKAVKMFVKAADDAIEANK